MKKSLFLSTAILTAAISAASANSIVSDVCVSADDDNYTLTVTTESALSSSAVINWDGSALTGPFTLSNSNTSISVTTTIAPCAEEGTITITDNGVTF